jgi:hypothetical protein
MISWLQMGVRQTPFHAVHQELSRTRQQIDKGIVSLYDAFLRWDLLGESV